MPAANANDSCPSCNGWSTDQLVPVWCAIGLVTFVLCVRSRLQNRSSSGVTVRFATSVVRLFYSGRARQVVSPEDALKQKLLVDAADMEHGAAGPVGPAQVAYAEMERVCTERNIARGLETASLAVLVVLQHRLRYGSVTMGTVGGPRGGRVRPLHTEPAERQRFADLLKAIDDFIQSDGELAADEEAPDVVFAWGKAPSTLASWSAQRKDEFLEVIGKTPDEEAAFKRLFEAFASDPDADVWKVPILSARQATQVRTWGAPARDFQKFRCSSTAEGELLPVPQILAAPMRDASAPAVMGEGFAISHEEFRRQVEAIATAVVRNADTTRSRVVMLYMGRGATIGPAFVAVLRARFQAVPVDVHWPEERIQAVAEDAQPALALADPTTGTEWALLGKYVPKVLAVDENLLATSGDCGISVESIRADDAAVMLFTSGSTGRPKGIMLPHRYVTALVAGVGESKSFVPQTRTLCYHSPTWMPFLDYLFGPLVYGGCCLFFPESSGHVVRPNELSAFAKKFGATVAGFVPAMFDIFLEEGFPETLSNIGVGGAPVPAELCTRALPSMPRNHDGSPGVLFTGYSGTEQGDVTQVQMRAAHDVERAVSSRGTMSAGGPHTAQRMAILDQGLSEVLPGGVGEVCVSGPGLASGYFGLPEKTAEAFITCAALGGYRASRTADLGKWNASGNLEVVGRRDSMVKVRGARIEIGEVETAVNAHPDVKTCVVTVYQDQLLAHVVPAVPGGLRDFCKQRLVAYMVPHIFEGIEELPRLPNGKVNKKALPPPVVRADGAETVMELDSLGQMRKFTRRAVSEDRILDNVRAILIGVVIQSHSTPFALTGDPMKMVDVHNNPLPGEWGSMQFMLLSLTRGGGWSSLAYLSGFDDTRGEEPYGLKYREVLFLVLWVMLDFNAVMWYLPAFVYMRAAFCWAHKFGLERLHIMVFSQFWLFVPAFVDFYVGWVPVKPQQPLECPSECFCPFQEWPWAQTFAYYAIGWWNAGYSNSFLGRAMIFIPCYWLGFYTGGSVFSVLTKITDDKSNLRRMAVAAAVLAVYCIMFTQLQSLVTGFIDTCESFWSSGAFVWAQVGRNAMYYVLNLFMSLLYVVFIAAVVPVHLKYLAKICFSSLLFSGYTPCLLNLNAMALYLRAALPSAVSPFVETVWIFGVPFLYEFVVGTIFAWLLPPIAKAVLKVRAKVFR